MKTELIKIIRKVLKEQSEKNPLSRTEIKFFKILNEKKHEYKTKKDLMNFITSMMPFIGKSEGDGLLYYELYVMNYRPEGDYENITPEEFKDVRKLGKKRTENINAWKFTKAKIPFKGSNLEGEWSTDNYSVPYYVVKSYGWYPIFLFKENQWYEVTDTYSSSTSKQMSNAYPVRYDDNLQEKVIGVSKNEIQTLIYGTLTFQQLVKRRKSDFDIALVAAGGYGMLVADYIFKEMNKSVMYIGGALQLFFGVIGKRWFDNKEILKMVNDDWIRPNKEDKPDNFTRVEKGCYW